MSRNTERLFNYMADVIESERRRNEFRNEHYRAMCSDNWGNKAMRDLVEMGAIFIAMETDRERSTDPALIDELIREWIELDLADFVLSDKHLSDKLSDELYDKARDKAARYERIKQATRSYDDRSRRSYDDRDRRDYRSPNDRRDYWGGNQRRGDDSHASGTGISAIMSQGVSRAQADTARSSRDEREPRETEVRSAEAPRINLPVSEGPDYTQPYPHLRYIQNGELWEYAPKSSLVLSDPTQASQVYNPLTEAPYLVMNLENKIVREEIVPMSNEMAYLRLEQLGSPVQRQRYESAQNSRIAPKNTDQYGAPSTMHNNQPTLSPTDELISTYLRVRTEEPTQASTVYSLDEADTLARVEHLAGGRLMSINRYIKTTPICTPVEGVNFLITIGNAPTLAAAAQIMATQAGLVSPELWDAVNARFTALINYMLTVRFGLKEPRITDFVADLNPLMEALRNNKKLPQADQQLGYKGRQFVSDAVNFLDGELADICVSNLLSAKETLLTPGVKPPVIVLVEDFVLITVSFSYASLGLKLDEKGRPAAIIRDRNPALYDFAKLLAQYSESNRNDQGLDRLYVLTSDHVRVEFVRSGWDDTNFLIRKMV
ncbi:hypothetical protein ACLPJK_25765 [Pseudomonas aeruginosa]|uniref:hypothetical protein n=1 Tax=Pseudomonas aeruginosa TaxID=287 RepID=UPI003D2E9A27